MDMCLLCLELKHEPIEGIKVTSVQWQDEDIGKIIEQHFWAIKSITSTSWLCVSCWEIVKDFHKFYTRIEEAHTYFVPMLKVELLENNDDIETVLPNDLPKQNSPETTDSKVKSITTKGKADESRSVEIKEEIINEEQLIPVDEEIPLKQNHENEDPLQKPLPLKCRKLRKSLRSEKAVVAVSNEETPEEEEGNVSESSIDKNTDKEENYHSAIDDSDVSSSSSSDSDSESEEQYQTEKPSRECKLQNNPSKYKTGTKRRETDEFLAKHFKIVCPICQSLMPTFHDLTIHFSSQHNEPAFVICCNKKFFKKSLLVHHTRYHLDPDYFKCKHCGKLMSSRRCLELHLQIHGNQDKTHICDICQKGFARKMGLKEHKLTHLPDDEKKFPCEQCGKLFGNNKLLVNHVRAVHLNRNALVCDICGEKMRGKDVFERHMLKHKGVDVPTIACDVCGLKLIGQRVLKRHKDSQHPEGGKREFPCHMCSHISPTLKAFKKHVKDRHELGYDFKCTLCEKAFKRASSLKEHMARHMGTTLYTCTYCPKKFNSNANMHSHRKKAHPNEWEEDCRAKYSGNLPEKYKINKKTTETNESNNDKSTIWNHFMGL